MEDVFVFRPGVPSLAAAAARVRGMGLDVDEPIVLAGIARVAVQRSDEHVFLDWGTDLAEIEAYEELPDGAEAPCIVVEFGHEYLPLARQVIGYLVAPESMVDLGYGEPLSSAAFIERVASDPDWDWVEY